MEKQALFNQILVIEDDINLCRSLVSIASEYASQISFCYSLNEAKALVTTLAPDLIILDFKLEDGSAIELWATLSECSPYPKVIVMSAYASHEQIFSLAQMGAINFLKKPFSLGKFRKTIEDAFNFSPPDYLPFIRLSVGHKELKDVESNVRGLMLREAIDMVGGSKRGAAKVLSVSRQFVQHAINKVKDRQSD